MLALSLWLLPCCLDSARLAEDLRPPVPLLCCAWMPMAPWSCSWFPLLAGLPSTPQRELVLPLGGVPWRVGGAPAFPQLSAGIGGTPELRTPSSHAILQV